MALARIFSSTSEGSSDHRAGEPTALRMPAKKSRAYITHMGSCMPDHAANPAALSAPASEV